MRITAGHRPTGPRSASDPMIHSYTSTARNREITTEQQFPGLTISHKNLQGDNDDRAEGMSESSPRENMMAEARKNVGVDYIGESGG